MWRCLVTIKNNDQDVCMTKNPQVARAMVSVEVSDPAIQN